MYEHQQLYHQWTTTQPLIIIANIEESKLRVLILTTDQNVRFSNIRSHIKHYLHVHVQCTKERNRRNGEKHTHTHWGAPHCLLPTPRGVLFPIWEATTIPPSSLWGYTILDHPPSPPLTSWHWFWWKGFPQRLPRGPPGKWPWWNRVPPQMPSSWHGG